MLFWTGTVPGPAGGGSGERGLGEVDAAGRPDAGRAGQRPRPSATQPLQTSARDPDGTHVQHQLRDPGLQQQRRGENMPGLVKPKQNLQIFFFTVFSFDTSCSFKMITKMLFEQNEQIKLKMISSRLK